VSAARSPAKILIVDADARRLETLKAALTTAAAYQVTSTTSASLALTTLERDRPDLIVCSSRTDDLDGIEFCSILRGRPATQDIAFLLVAGRKRPTAWAVAQAGVDMMLAGGFVLSAVLDRVSKLLRHVVPPAEPGMPPPPLPPRVTVPRSEAGVRTFEGSFGVLDLTEVAQAIALGGKTGRLSLEVEGGGGLLLFDSGRVVHAEFASLTGESAFAAMVRAAQADPEGTFRFRPGAEQPAGSGMRTIQKSVDQLLLSIASDIDEGRAAAGAPLPPRGT